VPALRDEPPATERVGIDSHVMVLGIQVPWEKRQGVGEVEIRLPAEDPSHSNHDH
jgi:hypothetical protein